MDTDRIRQEAVFDSLVKLANLVIDDELITDFAKLVSDKIREKDALEVLASFITSPPVLWNMTREEAIAMLEVIACFGRLS